MQVIFVEFQDNFLYDLLTVHLSIVNLENTCILQENGIISEKEEKFKKICLSFKPKGRSFNFFLQIFPVTSHHFVEPLLLCFRLRLTLPMGFKARVDPSSPALCSRLHIMILLRVNSEFPG